MDRWIKLDTGYRSHPKVLRLRQMISPEADCYPVRLWLWCAEHSPSGIVDPTLVESVCEWSGEKGKLLEVMRKVGLLDDATDSEKELHGWMERSGATLSALHQRKEKDRKRAAKAYRKSKNSHAENPRRIDGVSLETPEISAKHRSISERCLGVDLDLDLERDKEKKEERKEEVSCSLWDAREFSAELKSAIQDLWAHYHRVWPRQASLTFRREVLLADCLRAFPAESLKLALDNSMLDPWPRRVLQSSIEVLIGEYDKENRRWICSRERVEGWLELPDLLAQAKSAEKGGSKISSSDLAVIWRTTMAEWTRMVDKVADRRPFCDIDNRAERLLAARRVVAKNIGLRMDPPPEYDGTGGDVPWRAEK